MSSFTNSASESPLAFSADFGQGIEAIIRDGAHQLIQQVIEAELAVLLSLHADNVTKDGRRNVVRNGYLPRRHILTSIGPVGVQIPKVRDRSRGYVKFNSAIVPPYVRRSQRVSAALPWLYLKGISTGDMQEALQVLLGDAAKNISAPVVSRLKAEWAQEFKDWSGRDLSEAKYAYWWADGIYTGLRQENDERQCLLVIMGVKADGSKERVAILDGIRESKESWRGLLLDLKARGLQEGPLLATGDGAMGFWAALSEVYPKTQHQRCWVHKVANVLNALPKTLQSKAKSDLQAIWMAATRAEAEKALRVFESIYGAKYPKAMEKLSKDEDELLAFFDFPAEHWQHIRTTNPIESTFATVRHRTRRSRNCVTRATFLGLAFKLIEEAEKSWNKIRAADKILELLEGKIFKDGEPVKDNQPDVRQKIAA